MPLLSYKTIRGKEEAGQHDVIVGTSHEAHMGTW